MGHMRHMAVIALLAAVALAGCANEATPHDADGPAVEATSTTGGIRGVVVDASIVPLADIHVRVLGTDHATTTDVDGFFIFNGLEPGTYFVEASHPFYDTQQSSAEVTAGVREPPALRIQLTRLITQDPFMIPFSFNGYIFCSTNVHVVYAEECGEGLGYPCELPPTVFGCGDRMGKNPNNQAGQEWFVDSPSMQTFIVEQTWDPSISSGGGQIRTFVSENWLCDPWCEDDYRFGNFIGSSPLYGRIDMEAHSNFVYNETTRFTTFSYAADSVGILLEQPYELYVHTFHILPAPEGWSLVNGDQNPF